jgi:hypothetical protein
MTPKTFPLSMQYTPKPDTRKPRARRTHVYTRKQPVRPYTLRALAPDIDALMRGNRVNDDGTVTIVVCGEAS